MNKIGQWLLSIFFMVHIGPWQPATGESDAIHVFCVVASFWLYREYGISGRGGDGHVRRNLDP